MAAVEGADRVIARFNAVPDAVRDAARRAMEQGAEEVVQMMRRLAPVESGALRASIGWTWGDAPAGALTIGTVGAEQYGTQRITIYAGAGDAFYARFVEFGTQSHSLFRNASVARGKRQHLGPQHPGTAAQPFFFPAYRALRQRVRARITRAVRKAARGEAGAG